MVVFVPLSVLAAAALQTIAYTGYKIFYNSFGVRPEEVGYDYASLFPRTAIPLAFILAFGLALLAAVSLMIAFVGSVVAGTVSILKNEKRREPNEAERKDRLLFTAFGAVFAAVLIASWLGLADAAVYLMLGVIATTVLIEHRIARDTASRSWLDVFLAPRIYRGSRRLVLIGFAVALPLLDASVVPSVATAVSATALLYIVDRFLPVVAKDREDAVEGGGRSPWLHRVTLLGLGGMLGGLLLTAVVLTLPSLGLSDRVRDVRAGRALAVDYSNPGVIAALLAEPRADRVVVRWVGNRPPRLFQEPRTRRITGVALTYFGSNNGISVFFEPSVTASAGDTGRVYRWPSAAVSVEAADTGGEP